MKLLALGTVIVVLGAFAAAANAEEESSPGSGVPKSVAAAVHRFVEVKGSPTERTMEGYSQFLEDLPKAEGGCRARPEARAAISRLWVHEAETQKYDVLYVEKGELELYKDAKKITQRRIRHNYVVALDQVGNWLDFQLREAKFGIKWGKKVAGDCGALGDGPGAALNWTEATKHAREALGNLELGYGV
ncbi:MAG TPA: hypothetical protein VF731_02310 [Solirubrobacterales bacterium]